jgi:hypothetical protein
MDAVLQIKGCRPDYAGQPVVHGLDLEVGAGEVVSHARCQRRGQERPRC